MKTFEDTHNLTDDIYSDLAINVIINNKFIGLIYPIIDKLLKIFGFAKGITWFLILTVPLFVFYSLFQDEFEVTDLVSLGVFLVYLLISQFLLYLFQEFLKVFVDIGINSNKTNLLLKQILESKDNDDTKRD
jgi:hypothetical protein